MGEWVSSAKRKKEKKAAAIKDHLYGAIFQCKYSKDPTPNRLSDDREIRGS